MWRQISKGYRVTRLRADEVLQSALSPSNIFHFTAASRSALTSSIAAPIFSITVAILQGHSVAGLFQLAGIQSWSAAHITQFQPRRPYMPPPCPYLPHNLIALISNPSHPNNQPRHLLTPLTIRFDHVRQHRSSPVAYLQSSVPISFRLIYRPSNDF